MNSNTLKYFILVSFFSLLYNSAKAHTQAIFEESKNYKLIHYHDLRQCRVNELNNIYYYGYDAIFNKKYNTYSFIILINKNNNDTLLNIATPPFSKVKISDDEKYINGFSNILDKNPFQFVVFSIKGNILYRKSLNNFQFKVNDSTLRYIAKEYPYQFVQIVNNENIEKLGHDWVLCVDYKLIDKHYPEFSKFIFNQNRYYNNAIKHRTISKENRENDWYRNLKDDVEIVENNGKITSINFKNNNDSIVEMYDVSKVLGINYFVDKNYISNANVISNKKELIDTTNKIVIAIKPYIQIGDINYPILDSFPSIDKLKFKPIFTYPEIDSSKIYTYHIVFSPKSSDYIKVFNRDVPKLICGDGAIKPWSLESDLENIYKDLPKGKTRIFIENITVLVYKNRKAEKRKLENETIVFDLIKSE